MKHKYILAALAASALVISCQQEENGPAQLEIVKTEELSLVLGDAPKSKVTVDGTTGDIAWNNGTDKIAVYVQGTGANEFQEKTVTDDAISVPLASGQSRAYFAVYPAASAVAAHYGNDYLAVQYPSSYDLTGKTVPEIKTFSPVPMVAYNTGSDALTFYHVGGLLRLSVAQTPATTTEMVVTFTGVNVTGTWTVTGGGTTSATLSSPTGTGNVVTYTMDALTSAQTVTLNVPIPQGSYTGLTAIRVDAKAGSTTLASYTYSVTPAWASVTRALGRKESLSFADATLEITSPAATIWKGLTTTYTASSDAAVTWKSDTPGVATVDSDGVVTGVSAGTANITATTNGGAVASTNSVAVYVNEVTGVTLAPASVKVNKDVTTPLTATITHTNTVGGTITSPYPFELTFSLDRYDYVRFVDEYGNAPVTVNPVSATSTTTTANAIVNAYGYALGESAATMTVTVPEGVFSGSYPRTATASVSCEEVTSITFPDWDGDSNPDGEPYKFRGYWIHPGFLFEAAGGAMSITGCNPSTGAYDPLVLLQHYFFDFNGAGKKFDGSTNTSLIGKNRCYFFWSELNAFDGDTSDKLVNWTLSLDDYYGDYEWRLPTGGDKGDFNKIFKGETKTKIKINSWEFNNSYGGDFIPIVVDLTDATTENEAAENYNGRGLGLSNIGNKGGDQQYQCGFLLIPDGAQIKCNKISYKSDTYGYSWLSDRNCIEWEDLQILTRGGCIFLPTAGSINAMTPPLASSSTTTYYWGADSSNSNGHVLLLSPGSYNTTATSGDLRYPVFLVRTVTP